MQMETFTRDTGSMTKLMARELIDMRMGLPMREIGLRTSSMVQESRLGQMVQDTRETTEMERRMERVF